jgi:hypothetical protein
LGNKFSILSPDQDMIKKMLHVAAMPPPNPSLDFWDNGFSQNSNFSPHEKIVTAELSNNNKKSMPDVTGKSLRAGLQVLQHFSLDIKLVGSGRIVSQHPVAGTKLINGNECVLEMQQEI